MSVVKLIKIKGSMEEKKEINTANTEGIKKMKSLMKDFTNVVKQK